MDLISMMVVSFSILWSVYFLAGGHEGVGLVLLSISLFFLLAYVVVLRKRNRVLSGHLLVGLLLMGVTISNFFTGGLAGSNDVAFVVIPVLSLFLLGIQGLVWVAVCIADISVFLVLARNGYVFPQLVPVHDVWLDSALTLLSSIFLIALIAFFYEKARIKAEKNILEAKERAEVANEAKSRFLANMSHELRTPLNAVIGLTEVTLKGELTEANRKNLGAVRDSARQLLSLVDDVLDFSSVESGKMSMTQAPFSPAQLFAELNESFEQRAEDLSIDLIATTQGDIPQNLVGDVFRIRQVITNLLDNAFKFTEHGSVHLKMMWQEEVLSFEVEDTGRGIAPSLQQQVFRPFSKPELLLSEQVSGSGLGLALCKELVTLMGGEIHLSSVPDEGSLFRVDIPAEQVSSPLPGHKYRLLVAEDDRIGQELLRAVLSNDDYSINVVSNGQEAVNEFKSGDYDLVLMDIQMPVMDGLEATRIIRDMNTGSRRVPVLALTAHALDEEKRKCFEAGMDDFIAKPFEPDVLLNLIGNWIQKICAEKNFI